MIMAINTSGVTSH